MLEWGGDEFVFLHVKLEILVGQINGYSRGEVKTQGRLCIINIQMANMGKIILTEEFTLAQNTARGDK